MKSIVLKDGSEWACNAQGEGVFSRKKDGSWEQQAGTGQTPRFATAGALSAHVRKNYRDAKGDELPMMLRKYGWT